MSERKLDQINEKLDEVKKDISDINVTLAKQEVSLAEHIRRTSIAEENINMLRKEIEPIKIHVSRVNTILMAIGFLATVAGAIRAFLEIAKFF